MTIVGFHFTKLSVEKMTEPKGKVSVSNNIAINDINEAKLSLGSGEQPALNFEFSFKTTYEPKIGEISMKGHILFIGDEKLTAEVLKQWKDKKSVHEKVAEGILRTVFEKCNIQSLLLSKEINLPSPIPLPKIQKGNKAPAKK